MTSAPSRKIVVLGMMARLPVAGVIWQTLHYLVGLRRLGYDVYYVEAHGCTPRDFMAHEDDDGWGKAAEFIAGVMRRFDFGQRWAYQARYAGDQCYGLSESQLTGLYQSAALLINLHGGTDPLPEHAATGRLVYLETDPVELQIELHHQQQSTIDFLAHHCAFFTFGENYGQADCRLPVSERFAFRPTRQPVVLDFWNQGSHNGGRSTFTTIANWRQGHRVVEYQGEVYHWSKHLEFLKFIDLPGRTGQSFELALSSVDEADRALLTRHGWTVTDGLSVSTDPDIYRDYISTSAGEFTVAKDQNVRLRTGWFSDRSATYLAAGRPVITQETGFSNILPTGEGLFAFSAMDHITESTERICSDPGRHGRAAYEVAREYFSHEVVLGRLLADLGL